MLERDASRADVSTIVTDVPLPFVVRLHCKTGLGPLLAEEVGVPPESDAWIETRVRDAGRTCTATGCGAPPASACRSPGPHRRRRSSASARRVSARDDEGPIRWRLGFPSGHRRALVWQIAKDVAAAAPELVNDPTQTTWDVLVDDGVLELVPRRADDPRFAWRVAEVPAASHPTVAAALAFVAGARPGERVWDPFVGSGAELVERARLGPCTLLGTDISDDALARRAREPRRRRRRGDARQRRRAHARPAARRSDPDQPAARQPRPASTPRRCSWPRCPRSRARSRPAGGWCGSRPRRARPVPWQSASACAARATSRSISAACAAGSSAGIRSPREVPAARRVRGARARTVGAGRAALRRAHRPPAHARAAGRGVGARRDGVDPAAVARRAGRARGEARAAGGVRDRARARRRRRAGAGPARAASRGPPRRAAPRRAPRPCARAGSRSRSRWPRWSRSI